MKKWLEENRKKIIWIGIFTLVIFPLVINIAFKIDLGIWAIQAEWDAGDALSFYGVIVAAILAVYGVHLSIDYSQKNYKEDIRNNVLPFFSVYNLKTKSKSTWNILGDNDDKSIENNASNEDGYHEYKIREYYYIIEEGRIELKDGFTESQKKLLANGGFKWIQNGGVSMCVASDHICHPMEIENVGNGAAISFRLGFNKKSTLPEERVYAYGIPVKVGEKLMIRIYSENCCKESANLGEYVLGLFYEDIYGNKYEQSHEIFIGYSDEKSSPLISIDYSEKQNLYGVKNNLK